MATELRKTHCNRDCPDACALHVTVEDGRAAVSYTHLTLPTILRV